MIELPCISLWQPHAIALFLEVKGERVKTNETRHWPAPARLIGKRVAIHAAVRRPRLDEITNVMNVALTHCCGTGWRETVPYGAVIGTATLAACRPMAPTLVDEGARPATALDEHFGLWAEGRFAWRMDDPVLLDEPIPTTGRQGWFKVQVEAEALRGAA